mmetsp:Transcript_7788/g.29151  ORF Transcript_7788/g.29151 Transcript_7788/m.29151 type:complete len:263 (+) Transcript_7788:1622-2410(+)
MTISSRAVREARGTGSGDTKTTRSAGGTGTKRAAMARAARTTSQLMAIATQTSLARVPDRNQRATPTRWCGGTMTTRPLATRLREKLSATATVSATANRRPPRPKSASCGKSVKRTRSSAAWIRNLTMSRVNKNTTFALRRLTWTLPPSRRRSEPRVIRRSRTKPWTTGRILWHTRSEWATKGATFRKARKRGARGRRTAAASHRTEKRKRRRRRNKTRRLVRISQARRTAVKRNPIKRRRRRRRKSPPPGGIRRPKRLRRK